jgi:hypothetical protein
MTTVLPSAETQSTTGRDNRPVDRGPSSFQSAILISAPATWYEWDVTPVVRQAVERRSRHIEMTLRARDAEATGNGWVDISGGGVPGQEPRLAPEY